MASRWGEAVTPRRPHTGPLQRLLMDDEYGTVGGELKIPSSFSSHGGVARTIEAGRAKPCLHEGEKSWEM